MALVALGCLDHEAAHVAPLAERAYDEARTRGWPFLSDVLERHLRDVAEDDRAVATAVTQALVRYDRLLGFACGSPASSARVQTLLDLAKGTTDLEPRLARIARVEERLGTRYSLPDWIVELVGRELGDAAVVPALERMNESAPRVVRVNTLRTTREACAAALEGEGIPSRPTRAAASGLVLEGRRSLYRTGLFARGEVESQDEASQLVAELVAPPPRSFAMDACAGGGGKTLALAALLQGKGKILALDRAESKVEELRRRARRAGASNVQAIAVDVTGAGDLLASYEGRASRVLVDAPCTGLGAIRRNPEARWRLRPEDLPRLVAQQTALTHAAARFVAPRGRLVYATCSFLPSEADAAVRLFLEQHPGFAEVTVRDVLGRARTEGVATSDGKYLRTWRFDGSPDGGHEGMDGFFAAVLRRVGP